MYKLVIEDDDGRATEIPLVRDEVTIGRKEGNTVRLPERNVSRRHARLFEASGQIWLEDAGSSYGIKVNGSRLHEKVQLQVGDHIQIGDYQIALQLQGDALEPVAPQSVPQDDDDVDTALLEVDRLKAPAKPPPTVGVVEIGQLVVISSNVPKSSFSCAAPELTIGREAPADIKLDHASVSSMHARIRFNGKRYSIVDLNSANGLSVNGEEVGARDLRNGDVIELGEVKLRFVRKNETGDLQTKVEAYQARRSGQKSTQLVVALALGIIVAVSLLVFVIIRSDGPAPSSTPAAPPTPPPVVATPTPPPVDVAALVQQGKTSMESQDWSGALGPLEKALAVDPANAEAEQLRNRTRVEALNKQTFEEFEAAVQRKDFDAISLKLTAIPKDSVYHAKAEVLAEQLRQERLDHHLVRGNTALEEERYNEAKAEFQAALRADPEAVEAQRGLFQVNHRLAKAQRKALATPEEGTARPPRARRPAKGADPSGDGASERGPARSVAAETAAGRTAPKPARVEAPDAPEPTKIDRAREAMLLYARARKLMNSSPKTAVSMLKKALRLNPKSAAPHRLLGNYYAEQGKPKKACRHLHSFLRLSPQHPQASAIRGQLAKFGCP